jgi:hypothetical protein
MTIRPMDKPKLYIIIRFAKHYFYFFFSPPTLPYFFDVFLLGEPLRRALRASRRAIRSITRIYFASLHICGWFRCYPSRFRAFGANEK